MMDKIRVLRIYEFIGPRDLVEDQLVNSIQHERSYGHPDRKVTIRAATLGNYPEIIDQYKADFSDD